MAAPRAHLLPGLVFTVCLVGLIAVAVDEIGSAFFFVLVGSVVGAVGSVLWLFPGSRLFSVALANLLGVYACVFQFLSAANFAAVSPGVREAGFVLPILAFIAGCWLRRGEIRAIALESRLGAGELSLLPALLWLAPVLTIGAATFAIPGLMHGPRAFDLAFLAAMAAIAGIVLFVSRGVATFLIDAGLLFEEFFERVRHLIVPTFAFLTFYSLIVIVFACLYRIVDHHSPAAHFMVSGVARDISFPEALYFSVVTVATVGYGDIVPASDAVRMLASVQVVAGLLLLLFGFSEIIEYSRERRRRHDAED